MHHGHRGDGFYVERFARNHRSEFDAFCAKRREAAFARAAAAAFARRERQSARRAATAAAKALRDARLVARAASASALALAAKVKKLPWASPVAPGGPRSPAALVALQQERRIRKKAKRVVAGVLKKARRDAAVLVGRVIEVGVRRVASRVVLAGEVPGKFQFECLSAFPPGCSRRCFSPKSKTMPRRKRSARKSGAPMQACTYHFC